ncbi:MAG TPA: phospholipid carrier-dependent glycosyltransferase, partial [Propionibacteriaceae bacterium]|nr:phospholipid carrier-dependent glycosyltransferase [Propionibacteriaceae bacterium]
VVPVVVVVAVVHASGMTAAPQRADDEGTYVSQAWAILHLNTLAHYTYWYDHPPLGWIVAAVYAAATGAFARAPNAVAAGREFLLFLQVVSSVLLYVLARRLELRRLAAAGAVLLFALSPLAVMFHRAVFLDNIATPFILAAFVLALSPARRLSAHAASGVCFGLAVLCKETSLLLLPALIWQLWHMTDRETRPYSFALAGSCLVLSGTFYLLFAALRGELLPGPGHVSLFDGVAFQLFTRDGGGSALDPSSGSRQTITSWLWWDQWLLLAGLALLPAGLVIRRIRPLAVGLATLVAMSLRPGYLPIPFVIGLLPLASLLVAAVADTVWAPGPSGRRTRPLTGIRRFARGAWHAVRSGAVLAAVVAAAVIVGPDWYRMDRDLMTVDHDRPLTQAQRWIEDNVPPDSPILVDDAIWVDLVRDDRPASRVVWFWKLDRDPEIRARYPDGWRNFDYVVSTIAVRLSMAQLPEISAAVNNGEVVASFGEGGDQVQVLRIQPDPPR